MKDLQHAADRIGDAAEAAADTIGPMVRLHRELRRGVNAAKRGTPFRVARVAQLLEVATQRHEAAGRALADATDALRAHEAARKAGDG